MDQINDGYQLVYPDCVGKLIERSSSCSVSFAALSWIVLRLNYSQIKELSGIRFDLVRVDYPGRHFTIGAKYKDPSIDREFAIVTFVESLLNSVSCREFLAFAIQNASWQNEIDRSIQ